MNAVRRVAGALVLALLAGPASAAVMTAELAQELARGNPSEPVPVIIYLKDRVDHKRFEVKDRRLRDNALVRALQDKAAQSQALLNAQLDQRGAFNRKLLWSINAVAATLPRSAVADLAALPFIDRIQYDAVVPFAATATTAPSTAAWNLNALHVPALWALGVTGKGVVVANMDTGVDPYHPDLAATWRGGGNSWFDPYRQHATPYDFSGHGTQTMGLIAGGATSGTAIGIAPNARWIAAKIYNDAGQGTLSQIHLAFQWLLEPDGNLATLDAPDIVNASWGLSGAAPGSCNLEFSDDIALLGAAGIMVVFAAGNDGPASATSASPANNPGSFSAGAIDESFSAASQSSRGPSGCDGTVFPRLAAPGVNVVTSDLSFGGMPVYATVSGTSFAAPHVAGAMALLAGAFPAATVTEIRNALTDTALDLGGDGPDIAFGYGLTDAMAAYNVLAAKYGAGSAPAITSSPPAAAVENRLYSYQVVATDASGAGLVYTLDTAPAGMSIQSSGLIGWTPAHAQVGTAAVTVRVTNAAGQFSTQAFTITVAPANGVPVAANDSYTVSAGSTLTVGAPGVLANDADPDGTAITAVLVAGPSHGALALSSDGSFRYTPAAAYSGADSFTYRASDGQALGNVATVSLTVSANAANKPPVAKNDSYSAPKRSSGTYTPQLFNVLSNDTDPDGAINPATVAIVAAPGQGTATVTSAGKVSYIPALRYTGTETFSYRVQDNLGAWSNTATVTVKVK